MPRPPFPEGLAKDKRLNIRLSPIEYKAVTNFALSQGNTISGLFRTALKEYAKGLMARNGKITSKATFPDTF